MTLEEHITKICGSKDIQIASLLAQVDMLRDQVTKLAAGLPANKEQEKVEAIKPNGKAEPVPAPPA